MKYIHLLLCCCFTSFVSGQDSIDLWHTMSTRGFDMYLHIETSDDQCNIAQLSVPSQSVDRQAAEYCHVKGDSLFYSFLKTISLPISI